MRKIVNITLSLFLFSYLIPRFSLGGVAVGVEDFFCFVLLFYLLLEIKKGVPLVVIKPVIPLFLFSVIFIPYGFFQSYVYLGKVVFPTEIWQYIKRLAFFSSASLFFYSSSERHINKFLLYVVLALFLYQLIGFFQVINTSLGSWLSDIYARGEGHLLASQRDMNKRVIGISGYSSSWGAFSAFSLLIASFLIFRRDKYSFSFYILMCCFFIIFLSFVNIIYSGSRGVIIAISLAFLYLYFSIAVNSFRDFFKSSIFFVFLFFVGGGGMWFFLDASQLDFLLYRFDALSSTGGGGRNEQVADSLDILSGFYDYLMGVSNAVQRNYGVAWGVEVEPINIFVNYGLVGFLLIYSIYFYFFVLFRGDRSNRIELVFFRSVILFYFIFSLGYFFYAELIVGIFPWVFMGYLYSSILRNCRA